MKMHVQQQVGNFPAYYSNFFNNSAANKPENYSMSSCPDGYPYSHDIGECQFVEQQQHQRTQQPGFFDYHHRPQALLPSKCHPQISNYQAMIPRYPSTYQNHFSDPEETKILARLFNDNPQDNQCTPQQHQQQPLTHEVPNLNDPTIVIKSDNDLVNSRKRKLSSLDSDSNSSPSDPVIRPTKIQRKQNYQSPETLCEDEEILTHDPKTRKKVKSKFRERKRTRKFNEAFSELRSSVPTLPSDKNCKIETLRLSMKYIEFLHQVIESNVKNDELNFRKCKLIINFFF